MKKIILLAAMVLGFAVAASAQPRAIGLRGGEVSYQHTLGENFIELNGGFGFGIGTNGNINIGATGIYNFMIAQPQWTDRGEWGFYAGPGVSLGLSRDKELNQFFNIAAAGMVGLEYTFWFPLQLSIDLREHLGFGSAGHGFYDLASICAGVRYRF